MTTAGDFLRHVDAGLQLAGQDESGELLWMGTPKEWDIYYGNDDEGQGLTEAYWNAH